jgi:hypothetical protein
MLVIGGIGVALFGLLLGDLQEATREAAELREEARRADDQASG